MGRDIYKSLGFFMEIVSCINIEENEWQGLWDLGLTYQPIPNIQFDCGANIGLTKYSDDVYYVGFSARY